MGGTETRGPADSGPFASRMRWFHRFHGVFMLVSALALAVLGSLAIGWTGGSIEKHADLDQINPTALYILQHPLIIAASSIPAIVLSIILIVTKRAAWTITGLGWLAILVPVGLVIFAFIASLAPSYQYQSL